MLCHSLHVFFFKSVYNHVSLTIGQTCLHVDARYVKFYLFIALIKVASQDIHDSLKARWYRERCFHKQYKSFFCRIIQLQPRIFWEGKVSTNFVKFYVKSKTFVILIVKYLSFMVLCLKFTTIRQQPTATMATLVIWLKLFGRGHYIYNSLHRSQTGQNVVWTKSAKYHADLEKKNFHRIFTAALLTKLFSVLIYGCFNFIDFS